MSQRSKNKRNKAKPVTATRGNVALLERAEPSPQHDERPIILYEARGGKRGGSTNSKAFSLAWDETEAMGITADMRRSGPGMLSDQDRKETLYQAYLNSVWISACVDVIAKRITSGGMVIELTEKGEDESPQSQAEYDQLHDFLHYINEDEDFLQLIRAIATDLLIYGEAYLEIVSKSGKPFSLHKIDCATMNYKLDKHGTVIQYIQNMTHSTDTVLFEPDEVIRFWLPDPKAQKKALSPIERILGSVDADAHMADWVRAFFRKGARPPFWIEFLGSKDEASRFVVWLRENYTGQANAHIPLVLYEGAKLHEIGKGAVDMDFEKGRGMNKQEILAGYQVPPAAVSQIESGNIGGGTGESQDKSLISNACDPLKSLIFEKFNFRIVQKPNGGFGIKNWRVTTRYKNLQADEINVKVDDVRIRNASATVNEVRAETGKPPLDGGNTPVFAVGKEVLPLERLAEMADEGRQQTQLAIQQSEAQLDMTKVQIDKAKNPPPPPPTIVQAVPPDKKKPVPDEKDQQQERYIFILQQSLARTNETLARLDEQLRIAQDARVYDEETQSFKSTLIKELQWQRESEIAFTEELKQEVATLRSLIEVSREDAPPLSEEDRQRFATLWNAAKGIDDVVALHHVLKHVPGLYPLSVNGDTPLSVDPDEAEAYYHEHGMVMSVPATEERGYDEGYKAIQNEATYQTADTALPRDEILVGTDALRDTPVLHQEGVGSSQVEDNRPEVVQHHTGIMIALKVDPEIATQLAIPDGEPAEEFHITLCYMGKTDKEAPEGRLHPARTQDTIKILLSSLAATSEPLHGVVGGLARFLPSESSDWLAPVIALVNVQGLQQWRQKLIDILDMAGYFVAANFDYTPHISISYIAPDAPMPITTLPAIPLDFYGIELCIGDDVTYFPFGGEHEESTQSPPETSAEASPTTEHASETRLEPDTPDHAQVAQDDESRGVEEQIDRDSEDDTHKQHALDISATRPGTEVESEMGELAQDETTTSASGQSDREHDDAIHPTEKNTHKRRQRKSSKHIPTQNNDRIEEQHNAEQETPAQSTESHDVTQSTNETQSNGQIHPVQEPSGTDDSGGTETNTGNATSESDTQQSITDGTNGESSMANDASSVVEDEKPKDPHVDHWQDYDPLIKDAMKALEKKGVVSQTWNCRPGACDDCLLNHGKTVPLHSRFPNGAVTTPCHGNCECECKENREEAK